MFMPRWGRLNVKDGISTGCIKGIVSYKTSKLSKTSETIIFSNRSNMGSANYPKIHERK